MDSTFLPDTNWVDIIVIIYLIRGSYIGLSRGFSVEIFKLLGSVAAGVISFSYYEQAGVWIAEHSFLSLQVANIISFSILILSLLFVFKIVRDLVFKILHLELFFGLEKWGGFILGLGRSIILVSLLLYGLTMLPGDYFRTSVEEKSFSGPYLKGIAPKVVDVVAMFSPKTEEK